jgi:hypothetical protein
MHAAPGIVSVPRVSVVLADDGSDFFALRVLPSLSRARQRGLEDSGHEVVVVARGERERVLAPVLESLSVPVRLARSAMTDHWMQRGALEAHGDAVLFVGDPGIASPTLVAAVCGALDAHGVLFVIVQTVVVSGERSSSIDVLAERSGESESGQTLMHRANPKRIWLDAVRSPPNLVVPRELFSGEPFAPRDILASARGSRVQIIGDGFVRAATRQDPTSADDGSGAAVDPRVEYFGVDLCVDRELVSRPVRFARGTRPRMSVIVVVHEMRREAPRTLRSLLSDYQHDVREEDYEIVVIENGSGAPLVEAEIRGLAANVSYHYLSDPPPSPAYAINYGAARSGGEVLCIMIDGACILSPGTLSVGLSAFRAFRSPVVATRYFALGPGLQRKTMFEGYDAEVEDRLLDGIGWPDDGYRLFEVSSPLTFGGDSEHWLTPWFESNCLFLPRDVFEEIGGCDERFDYPGGGGLNLDLFSRACDVPRVQPVQLIGEGVFHQIHGGITSNAKQEDVDAQTGLYRAQYKAIRGKDAGGPTKSFYFLGRLASGAARWKMRG